jgi:hypothetical protein
MMKETLEELLGNIIYPAAASTYIHADVKQELVTKHNKFVNQHRETVKWREITPQTKADASIIVTRLNPRQLKGNDRHYVVWCEGNATTATDTLDQRYSDARQMKVISVASDPRGMGINDDTFLQSFNQAVTDKVNAVKHLAKNEPNFDYSRITLIGQSLGGAVAVIAAAQLHKEGMPVNIISMRSIFSTAQFPASILAKKKTTHTWYSFFNLSSASEASAAEMEFLVQTTARTLDLQKWMFNLKEAWDAIPLANKKFYTVAENLSAEQLPQAQQDLLPTRGDKQPQIEEKNLALLAAISENDTNSKILLTLLGHDFLTGLRAMFLSQKDGVIPYYASLHNNLQVRIPKLKEDIGYYSVSLTKIERDWQKRKNLTTEERTQGLAKNRADLEELKQSAEQALDMINNSLLIVDNLVLLSRIVESSLDNITREEYSLLALAAKHGLSFTISQSKFIRELGKVIGEEVNNHLETIAHVYQNKQVLVNRMTKVITDGVHNYPIEYLLPINGKGINLQQQLKQDVDGFKENRLKRLENAEQPDNDIKTLRLV